MARIFLTTVLAVSAALTMFAGCQSPPEQTSTTYLRESADHHFEVEDYAQAAVEYQELADRFPGDWYTQYRLGLTNLELENYNTARTALQLALEQRPNNVSIADALARAMYRQGDEAALFQFLRNRAEQTKTTYAWMRLARYAMDIGDPDSAMTAVETAIELDDGKSIEPYLLAAEFARSLNDAEEEVRRLRQVLYIEPANQTATERLRALGKVPGPTFALEPGR